MTIKQTFIIIALLSLSSAKRLMFNIEYPMEAGTYVKKKAKHLTEDIGEDSWYGTPYTLTVADGVSDYTFSSRFMAAAMVNKMSSHLIGLLQQNKAFWNVPSEFMHRTHRVLVERVKELRRKINELYNAWEDKRGRFSPVPREEVHVGATLACSFLQPYEDRSVHRIFIRGDSQVIIWRAHESVNPRRFYVEPFFVTKPGQNSFNYPFSYRSDMETQDSAENTSEEVEAIEGDAVMAASDGLWDNIHPSFLQVMVNSFYMANLQNDNDILVLEKRLMEYAKLYLCALSALHFKIQEGVYKPHLSLKDMNDEGLMRRRKFYFPRPNVQPECLGGIVLESVGISGWTTMKLNELSQTIEFPKAELELVKGFFACPLEEMVHPTGYDAFDSTHTYAPPVSKCMTKVLSNSVQITKAEYLRVAKQFSVRRYSEYIARMAKFFSEQSVYPSTFYIHGWKAGRFETEVATGKPDDITILFAGTYSVDDNKTPVLPEIFAVQVKENQDKYDRRIERDLPYMLDEYVKLEKVVRQAEEAEKAVAENAETKLHAIV